MRATTIEMQLCRNDSPDSPQAQKKPLQQKVIKIKTYRVEQSTLVVYVEEKSETAAVPVKQKNIFAGRAVVSVLLFTERHF